MEKKIILFMVLIIFLLCFFISNGNFIKLCNYPVDLINLNNFSFNVITLYNPDRLLNISEQEKILPNIKINKFNAIRGIELNQDKLVKNKILSTKFKSSSIKRSNEIGCYLSHLELLKSFLKSPAKYHIVFEDDFKFVLSTDFISMLNNAISQTKYNSFDIIFLGWDLSNKKNSEKIPWSKNLFKFKPNNSFYGTYAYMVNSNSLDKIINLISQIDMPIDTKYNVLYLENKLDLYWLNPVVIEPNFSLESTILTNP